MLETIRKQLEILGITKNKNWLEVDFATYNNMEVVS